MLCRILTICPLKCFILLSLWLLEIIVIIMCYCHLCLSPCWQHHQKHHQVFAILFISCFVDLFLFIFPVDCLSLCHMLFATFSLKNYVYLERASARARESERERYFIDGLNKDALVFLYSFWMSLCALFIVVTTISIQRLYL